MFLFHFDPSMEIMDRNADMVDRVIATSECSSTSLLTYIKEIKYKIWKN